MGILSGATNHLVLPEALIQLLRRKFVWIGGKL